MAEQVVKAIRRIVDYGYSRGLALAGFYMVGPPGRVLIDCVSAARRRPPNPLVFTTDNQILVRQKRDRESLTTRRSFLNPSFTPSRLGCTCRISDLLSVASFALDAVNCHAFIGPARLMAQFLPLDLSLRKKNSQLINEAC